MWSHQERGTARVVVVDDEPALLDLIGDVLSTEGYEVWRCKGADGALSLIETAEPQAVVLDLYMDGETKGWDILQHLKRNPRTRDLPVLLCSSAVRSLIEYEPLITAYGVRTLRKPFDPADLTDTLRQMLMEHRLRTH